MKEEFTVGSRTIGNWVCSADLGCVTPKDLLIGRYSAPFQKGGDSLSDHVFLGDPPLAIANKTTKKS